MYIPARLRAFGISRALDCLERDPDNNLPKLFKNKKTVGFRMPQNNIVLEIVRELGNPLMTSSIFHDDDTDYMISPELIDERYGRLVDLVIDGGDGGITPSTIVDCTGDEPVVVREGAGTIDS